MVVATPGTVAEAAPREIPVVEEDRRDNAQPDGLEAQRTISGSGPVYSVFSVRAKRGMILMATVAAFFSPFTANIYFPALNQLASQLHVTSNQIAFTITSYLIMQGLAPTFVGDFADSVGRRPAYLFCFILYIAASIGCALSPNFAALLVLRMLQSSGSSGTMSLASGVAADISVSSERGTYMGWAMSGTMTAPALGPIVGGLLANFLGWRAIFCRFGDIRTNLAQTLLTFCPRVLDHHWRRDTPRAFTFSARDRTTNRRQWVQTATTLEHIIVDTTAKTTKDKSGECWDKSRRIYDSFASS